MNSVLQLVNDSMAQRLGWVLLHSLWQGAFAAIVYALLRSALRHRSADTRYVLACVMLCCIAAAPILTFLYLSPGPVATLRPEFGALSLFATRLPASPRSLRLDSNATWSFADWNHFLDPVLPWLVIIWMVGVMILSCRWVQGYGWVRRLRRVQNAALDGAWLELLEDLKVRFNVSRPVRLVSSTLAEVPMVIGWLRPVILLPASSLMGLTPEQLEAILVHELAHVRRCDYLVNAFQNLVETVMFYHPAVWWISGCIRQEREHCCDDMVVRVCRDRLVYARALFRLEELRGAPARLAFAASGGPLLGRIRRLVAPAKAAGPITGREFGGMALATIGCLLVLVGCFLMLGAETYSSTVRMRIEHNYQAPSALMGGGQTGFFSDPYFIQTEFEVIQSEIILGKVIEDLNLDKEWSRKYGRVLKPPEFVALLRRQMDMRPVRNTSIIELRVYDHEPARAADIANKIAETYRDFRKADSSGHATDRLEVLLKQLKEQDAAIAELRNALDKQRTRLHLEDNFGETSIPKLSAETLRKIEGLRIESQAEYVRSKVLLDKLKTLTTDELVQAIPTTGIQDTLLSQLLEQMALSKQKLAALTTEYGPQHSEVRMISSQIEELREKINDRTKGFLIGLAARVDSLAQGLTDLNNEVAKATQADTAPANANGTNSETERYLEDQQEIRRMLLLKIASEKTEVQMPKNAPVQIVDRAFPSSQPAVPNRPRAICLLVAGAILAALGLLLCQNRSNHSTWARYRLVGIASKHCRQKAQEAQEFERKGFFGFFVAF